MTTAKETKLFEMIDSTREYFKEYMDWTINEKLRTYSIDANMTNMFKVLNELDELKAVMETRVLDKEQMIRGTRLHYEERGEAFRIKNLRGGLSTKIRQKLFGYRDNVQLRMINIYVLCYEIVEEKEKE